MVLVRLCHAADLPTPDEAIRMLRDDGACRRAPRRTARRRASVSGGGSQAAREHRQRRASTPMPCAAPAAKPELMLRSFEDVIAKARAERDRLLVFALERHVRPIRFEPGQIEIALTEDAEPTLPQKLGEALQRVDGRALDGGGQQGRRGGDGARDAQAEPRPRFSMKRAPIRWCRRCLERFPGAEIVGVREKSAEPQPIELDPPPHDGAPPIDMNDVIDRADED